MEGSGMTPFYLQTETEAGMWTALDQLGFATDGHITVEHSIIGQWFERTGGTDEEPVMEPLPGWHFNLMLAEAPAEWPAGVTQHSPQTPWRIWG